jgi:hypothetical protein
MLHTAESTDTIMSTTIMGTVKRIFPNRGYCWLAGDDGVDYFGHQTHFQNGIKVSSTWVGQRCTFIPGVNEGRDNKPMATNIVMVDPD